MAMLRGVAEGADDGERINSVMRPKAFVFGADRGGEQVRRQLVE
jgi:hypothetical protein